MKPGPIERLGHPGGLAGPDEVSRRWPKFAAAMLAVAVLAGVGGYAYESMTRQGPVTSREVPLIKADANPTKKRPEDPGGMAIPNQDKLVYQALSGEGAETKVERILPPPEEPIPLPPDIEPAAGPETTVPAPAEVPVAAVPASPVPAAEVPPPPEPAAVAAVEPSPAAESYLVQLAALRSAEAANKAWRQLTKANADLLGKLRPNIVRADLGAEKGVYFRLRAGPLRDEAAAKGLCAELKARKLGCLVIRP